MTSQNSENKSKTPSIDAVLTRMGGVKAKPALFWKGKQYLYPEFMSLIEQWDRRLLTDGIKKGSICSFLGDFSPQTCALMFALMKANAILVPFSSDVVTEMDKFREIACVETLYRFDKEDNAVLERFSPSPKPSLVIDFLERQHPGLIVFTSGSTGTPKGILQDCEHVTHKFVKERKGWRTGLFLLMDHFGGFNTFLSCFAYSGMAVCLAERTPESVAQAIEASKATLLPTTPTFLNLLIASRLYKKYDFSSIELITYGTELMSEITLKNVAEIFPKARLKQTYGLSELGVLRSSSENQESVWVKVGGIGFETKIVDNMLWIRSETNMVGYLNAPNPFDDEGWMCTGDEVEMKGEYLRFLGRTSEIINVGGKKVFPIEVENLVMQASNVKNVTVYARPHPLMGQAVYANIVTFEPEDQRALTERLRKYCNERLAKYKVPLRFNLITDKEIHNSRFKKIRKIVS
jgi:long-chain acyl-CoA synthetase